jgi:hypothetical protein
MIEFLLGIIAMATFGLTIFGIGRLVLYNDYKEYPKSQNPARSMVIGFMCLTVTAFCIALSCAIGNFIAESIF